MDSAVRELTGQLRRQESTNTCHAGAEWSLRHGCQTPNSGPGSDAVLTLSWHGQGYMDLLSRIYNRR